MGFENKFRLVCLLCTSGIYLSETEKTLIKKELATHNIKVKAIKGLLDEDADFSLIFEDKQSFDRFFEVFEDIICAYATTGDVDPNYALPYVNFKISRAILMAVIRKYTLESQ